jgi:uncharacterized protein (UPF0333 family)
MGGGLLQLVAYGAQDVYLTGNPQITFFKVVYRRHTNFAMEAIQQTFNGVSAYGNTVTCQISRNGDLIHRMYLQVDVPVTASGDKYVNYLGPRLINNIVIEIGGQQIDKHYSDWLYIWNELSLPMGKQHGYDTMVGADSDLTSKGTTLYIPLEFWFCRNIGLALPLIALQYHEVKIKLQYESAANCMVGSGVAPPLGSANLWVDYIFLDTDERRRFAQVKHEYLIEQLQFSGDENISSSSTTRVKLNFNHPCKELIWVAKKAEKEYWYNYTNSNTWNMTDPKFTLDDRSSLSSSNFGNFGALSATNHIANVMPSLSASNPFGTCLLQLNGNDRFASRNGNYFSLVQPYQHHSAIPVNKGINVYSFALKPEDHQPSGSLNMSRIDTAVLSLEVKKPYVKYVSSAYENADYTAAKIFAVNYNVLRILSGMGGLAYSN